jgi:hypothetical protein
VKSLISCALKSRGKMLAKVEWTIYKPSQRVGKLCYYLCSDRSVLPIRDVLNSHGKGFKKEPNYETATYNWCAKCNQRSVVAAVKDGLSHLLFITRYTGKNEQYKGQAIIVGYYEIGEVAIGSRQTAVRAKKMCFVPVDKAYSYPVDNLRWATQRINENHLEEIINHLNAHDVTDDYLYEVAKLKAEYNPYSAVPSGRIFIINVGANTASPLQSPLFHDGKFEFVPIPEHHTSYSDEFLTYGDLKQFYMPDKPLLASLADVSIDPKMKAHNDPEFATFTYGDNVNQKQNLNDLNEGDLLFFLARLVPYDERFHHNKAIFALIGYLEIAERLDDVVDVNPAFNQNAHILRWKADSSSFEGFALFKGSVNSRRFHYAVPFDRKFVEEVPILTANGQRWNWMGKTELGAIGAYTRAVRLHIDPSNDNDKMRANRFWHLIWQKQRWGTEN